eukprot:GHVP01024772.1.p1 GENE.GHVP01024772.1~~GHVP01024772.1.p1  ORF type:complete len:255 (-),score=45.85 GHVP01024772.1:105-869(-)
MSSPTNSTCNFTQTKNLFDQERQKEQFFDGSVGQTSKILESADRFDSLDDFSPGPKLGSNLSTKFFSLSESASSSSPNERKHASSFLALNSNQSSMHTSSSGISSPRPLKGILKKRTDDFSSFGQSFGSFNGSPLAIRSATIDPSVTRDTASNNNSNGLFLPISSRQADSDIWFSVHSMEFQTPKGNDGKMLSFSSDNVKEERIEDNSCTSGRTCSEGKVGFDENSTTYEYEPVHLSSLEMDAMFPDRDSDIDT